MFEYAQKQKENNGRGESNTAKLFSDPEEPI